MGVVQYVACKMKCIWLCSMQSRHSMPCLKHCYILHPATLSLLQNRWTYILNITNNVFSNVKLYILYNCGQQIIPLLPLPSLYSHTYILPYPRSSMTSLTSPPSSSSPNLSSEHSSSSSTSSSSSSVSLNCPQL